MARKQVKREVVSDPIQPATTSMSQAYPLDSGDTVMADDRIMGESNGTGLNRPDGAHAGGDNATSQNSTATVGPSSPPAASFGASQGLEALGRGVKELVQAIQDLRQLGVEDFVISLPKIVVVGDQSTGKSSLIEGISEIKVPRKHGVCTRKYMYDGGQGKLTGSRSAGKNTITTAKSGTEGATRKRPLGPWVAQEGEYFIFAKTYDKDDVASLLEWAQIATLNPQSSHKDYIPTSPTFKADRNCLVKFSPNVVQLEISGPNLPNLSFYDLPGVINVSDVPEESYLVDLVKNLVRQYIKAENCINLLALPMTDDPANSSASRLIRDEEAETRTIGVLTKPDRVQETESLEQWVQILAGQRFGLGHGYHVVKNNPDVTVDHAVARAQEQEFFANSPPWSTILRKYEHRFGTLQLQTFLSQRLTAQIRHSLPQIARQVQSKLEQLNTKLETLPERPAGNLPLKIMEQLLKFESNVQKHFDGGNPDFTLPKQWHNLADKFRKILADSRPMLLQPSLPVRNFQSADSPVQETPTPTPARKTHRSFQDCIEIDSASDNEVSKKQIPILDRVVKKRINGDSPQDTSAKRMRMSDIPLHTASAGSEKTSYSKRFSLTEIRNTLQDAHIGLPNQIDPKTTQSMIKLSVKVWELPTQNFLESTLALCQQTIFNELHEAFSEWKSTLFHRRTEEICGSFLENIMVDQREIIMRMLGWEMQKPMTRNVEAITAASDDALAMLQARRREYRASEYLYSQESNIDKTSSRQSKTDRLAKVTEAQLGTDPYKQEVLAISNVKGYYECAFSRFVDNVCQSITCELFYKCRNQLGSVLKHELRVTEADVDPKDEQERRQVTKEQEKLRKAQSWLEQLALTAEDGLNV
ncbi:MAG: hypothetical protein Q9195_000115 [Heterodermia aff. obscurata]